MSSLHQYKNYFTVIAALMFALYVTDPILLKHQELTETLALNNARAEKMLNLLNNSSELAGQVAQAEQGLAKVKSYFYREDNEGSFQLAVQQQLESVFKDSGCELQSLNWVGKVEINQQIDRWRVKVSFVGKPSCLVKLTRGVESQVPAIRFYHYSYGAQGWQGKPQETLSGDVELMAWHFKELI